jgi:nicotinamidase/pyrazinamidase
MSKHILFRVDIQNGFCPGGNLPVPEGDQIIDFINTLGDYDLVIDSADWHPSNHKSFAASHPGKQPFIDGVLLNGIAQRLWPVHCIAGTKDSEFKEGLKLTPSFIVHKGLNPEFENYSPFFSNTPDNKQGEILDANGQNVETSSLVQFLKAQEVSDIDVVGLATDYCVKAFVLDALKNGFKVRLLTKGCRGVNVSKLDSVNAIKEMWQAGADVI